MEHTMCKNIVFYIETQNNRDKRFVSSPRDLGPTEPFIEWVSDFFPGVNRPERGVNHTPPSSAEVKKERNYTSTLSICLRGIDKENFAFLWKCFIQPHGNESFGFGVVIRLCCFTFDLIQTALLTCAPNG